jgi:predicted phosphodiesterase
MSRRHIDPAKLQAALADLPNHATLTHCARAHNIAPRTLCDYRRRAPAAPAAPTAPTPSGTTRILVCPDAHHPYVNRQAWEVFLAAARQWQPHVVVVIGDFLDCYSISDYIKDPCRVAMLDHELTAGAAALEELTAAAPNARRIFCAGNHEDRLDRLIAKQAPALKGLLSIRELLQLDQRQWEWKPYRAWVRIGKIAFVHDVGHAGANGARQSLAAFGGNIVIGHTHRAGLVIGGTVEGEKHVCLNVGWLGDLEAVDYGSKVQQQRDWCHGFGTVTLDAEGNGWCQFHPILSGRTIVDGQVIQA